MSDYVIVLVRQKNTTEDVLFVVKDKPEWQKGKFNLPGGKIEDKETIEEAAIRETKEESGYDSITTPIVMGKIQDGDNVIHCVNVVIDSNKEPNPRDEETQEIMWLKWNYVKESYKLIPNLRLIIPLMICNVSDWVLGDTYRENSKKRHVVKISLPTKN